MAAAEHCACIYACGGQLLNGSQSGGLLRLDPRCRSWTTLPAMPTPSAFGAAAVVSGRLYVPGGLTGVPGHPCWHQAGLHSMQCFDMAAGRWDTGCMPMALPRSGHGVATFHGEVRWRWWWAGSQARVGTMARWM